jgi:hypothetical protein
MTRGRLRPLAAVLLAIGALALVVGCGEEETLHVEEGEPLELDELAYNVQVTRFLNPEATEDAAYLRGQSPPAQGEAYLAVFMQVANEGDEPAEISDHMEVVDTRDNRFEPVENESEFALQPGALVPADGEVPEPGTVAATGPDQGALVLFLVEEAIAESRPVELEITDSDGETGVVELDL